VVVVYQLTFFLALALLAISITVFVFAVSLLGRAMEAAAKVERSKIAERKENNVKAMADIRKEIEEAEAKEEIPGGLRRRLEKLEKKNKDFDSELSRIRKAPKLLTVKGGVIHPCTFLVIALVLSGTASYLSGVQNLSWVIPLSIWIPALAAIGYSIYRTCESLKVIENVAVTSEEAWIAKTVEAFKIAQKELEEEKKPKLQLTWRQPKAPVHIKADSTLKLVFSVGLEGGNVADNVFVAFSLPPGFDFPGSQTVIQADDVPRIPKFISARVNYRVPITPGPYIINEVIIKSTPVPGTYTAYYCVGCRGSTGDLEKFEIVVE